MNNFFLLVLISVVLMTYGFYRILSLFWLGMLIYPRAEEDQIQKCLRLLKELEFKFVPNYPNLKNIYRYIKSFEREKQNDSEWEYISIILDDLTFLRSVKSDNSFNKSVLEKFRKELTFLRKLFSS